MDSASCFVSRIWGTSDPMSSLRSGRDTSRNISSLERPKVSAQTTNNLLSGLPCVGNWMCWTYGSVCFLLLLLFMKEILQEKRKEGMEERKNKRMKEGRKEERKKEIKHESTKRDYYIGNEAAIGMKIQCKVTL